MDIAAIYRYDYHSQKLNIRYRGKLKNMYTKSLSSHLKNLSGMQLVTQL